MFCPKEIAKIIKDNLSLKKSTGCELITPEIIIELPHSAVGYMTQLLNAITWLLSTMEVIAHHNVFKSC